MPIPSTINIVRFTEHPCCSWKLTKQHACDNPITRHYKDGILEAKLYAPVQVYRDGESFTVTDGNTYFYINYNDDVIQIEGVEIDRDVVTVDGFEAYLQGLFCCTEAEVVLPAYTIVAGEMGVSCTDDVTTVNFEIVNTSGIPIPAGTFFLLEWTGLPEGSVFQADSDFAIIAIDGITLELTEVIEPDGSITFGVSFDNEGCVEGQYSVSITPNDDYTLTPNQLVLSVEG